MKLEHFKLVEEELISLFEAGQKLPSGDILNNRKYVEFLRFTQTLEHHLVAPD